MKRSSISIISFALFLLAIFSSFTPQNATTPGPVDVKSAVRYQVNVQFSMRDFSPCYKYVVQVLDQNRMAVAPPLTFDPKLNSYSFEEKGPVVGVRVAVLVRADLKPLDCFFEVVTTPSFQYGTFFNGNTYYFVLHPGVIELKTTHTKDDASTMK
jgi:hypothetical protein